MLDKTFAPQTIEDKFYALWENKGYFQTVSDPQKIPYVIMMPPPRVASPRGGSHPARQALAAAFSRDGG